MRILFAGDEHPYSAYALKKVIELARHTWADVTLLAVSSEPISADKDNPLPPNHSLIQALHRYRDDFLNELGSSDSPYAECQAYKWIPLKNGLWEEMKVCRGIRKEIKTCLTYGNTDAEILGQSVRDSSDLIVLGCGKGKQCSWESSASLPQKIVSNADSSVFLVKEDKPIRRILACIDQTSVSQESLEMINQMVTIHKAQLELVGLTKDGGAKPEAYTRMIEIGDYYSDRGIGITTRLMEQSEFEAFVSKDTDGDLLVFCMGKKSLLTSLFPKDRVERFVSTCQSSVLILR